MTKPSIPKGTRDFGPLEMARRNYIFNTVSDVFLLYGYSQIETPSLENLSTLLGKYGDEGDKLLFKILNSGDCFAGIGPDELSNSNALAMKVCEKGLRYDLTVPFARFVVQHQNEINFPFKRFQIQPVWRADRPQKGRYREFYQCDVDVIGSNSNLNELELVQIVNEVFTRFGIRVCLKINNRKLLAGLAEVAQAPDKIVDITVAIDKIDKIGIDAVKEEMREKGISEQSIAKIEPVLLLKGTNEEKIATMKDLLAASEVGTKGVEEISELFSLINSLKLNIQVEVDLSLARGLNYYTGAIFEVKALDYEIGSICGGGRYDDLTGIFGLKNVSGVGISFGADRIYDVLAGLGKYPSDLSTSVKVLFTNMGKEEVKYILPLAAQLRSAGLACEVYPESSKLKKQFEYADKRGIGAVVVAGETEIAENKVTVKNMKTGEQTMLSCSDLLKYIQNNNDNE
ncbi:MAG: histidine--tRNA ligase [Bacteroidales bacterium]|nr:histidine--tRNA ligase [Bacteroidales bacterium]